MSALVLPKVQLKIGQDLYLGTFITLRDISEILGTHLGTLYLGKLSKWMRWYYSEKNPNQVGVGEKSQIKTFPLRSILNQIKDETFPKNGGGEGMETLEVFPNHTTSLNVDGFPLVVTFCPILIFIS